MKHLLLALVLLALATGCASQAAAASAPPAQEVFKVAVASQIGESVYFLEGIQVLPSVRAADSKAEGVYVGGKWFEIDQGEEWTTIDDNLSFKFTNSVLQVKYNVNIWTHCDPPKANQKRT
jgi:hypothetical protein